MALVRLRGSPRRVAALCVGIAAVLPVMPPAVSSYDSRYTVPPAMVLAVAAALALGVRGRPISLDRRP